MQKKSTLYVLLTRAAGSVKYSLGKGSKLSTVTLGSNSPGTLLSVELCCPIKIHNNGI